MGTVFESHEHAMQHALRIASLGLGHVEPNPPVGAVVVDGDLRLIAEGYHEVFGGPHAEVRAFQNLARSARSEFDPATATLFVTLEPCCHHGKTPPCSQAVLESGIRKVVIATTDPAAHVAGKGIEQLRAGGVDVSVGVGEAEARSLISPFAMLQIHGRPWVHAKWAMSLDGRIATSTGHSQWISNSESRAVVHRLRGRMDAVIAGIGTVHADNPMLNARPAGPRTAVRIVIDRMAETPIDSALVQTAAEHPVLVVHSEAADSQRLQQLMDSGVELWRCPSVQVAANETTGGASASLHLDLSELMSELGRRQMTNVLVEGGGGLMGSFRDQGLIDEVHCFIAPKLIGGRNALGPVGGQGRSLIPETTDIEQPIVEKIGGDTYIHGAVRPLSEVFR